MPANQEFDNTNSLILFPNTRMREGKRDPQWTGTLTDANGQEYWLSVWEKSGAKGDFFTGSFRIKEDKPLDKGVSRTPSKVGIRRSRPTEQPSGPDTTEDTTLLGGLHPLHRRLLPSDRRTEGGVATTERGSSRRFVAA